MILYDYWRSSAAYRVRIALNLKGLEVEHRSVDLLGGEHRGSDYRAITPAGLVPALELDDGRVLNQSIAILRYLDTVAQPRLFPPDPLDDATVTAMALGIACDIHPINNQRVLNYITETLGASKEQKFAWYAHWVQAGFAALEQDVARLGAGCCFGDTPTAVDCCLVPQMYNARRFSVDLTAFPRLVAIDAALREIPAFAEAAPEAQETASETSRSSPRG